MSKEINCSKCGADFVMSVNAGESTVKCPECGEQVQITDESAGKDAGNRKPCPKCGEPVMATAVFCKHCRSDIGSVPEITVGSVNDTNDRRNAEFVMGLLGGIFGIIGAISVLMFAGIGAAFKADGADQIGNLSVSAIIFAIWGIVGAVVVRNHGKLGGLFMLASAIGGVIAISMGYLLSGVLLGIAGIMSLRKKNQNSIKTRYALWIPVSVVIFAVSFMLGNASKPTADLNDNNVSTPSVNAATGATSDTPTEQTTESKPKLELLTHNFVSGEITSSIEGTVRNNSNETLDYVEIVFNLYDENDAMLGTSMTNITGLEPGATWKYSAMVTEDKAAKYKLAKLGDSVF